MPVPPYPVTVTFPLVHRPRSHFSACPNSAQYSAPPDAWTWLRIPPHGEGSLRFGPRVFQLHFGILQPCLALLLPLFKGREHMRLPKIVSQSIAQRNKRTGKNRFFCNFFRRFNASVRIFCNVLIYKSQSKKTALSIKFFIFF